MSENTTPAGTAPSLLDRVPVVPVVVLHDVEHAVPVARALVAGGLPVIELTLRTPAALEAVERIAAEVPEILVGVHMAGACLVWVLRQPPGAMRP